MCPIVFAYPIWLNQNHEFKFEKVEDETLVFP